LAETIAHTEKFRGKIITLEKKPLNFTSENDEIYNKHLSVKRITGFSQESP